LIEKTQERQAATLSEVTWRGRTIPVKNEKVRVFLMGLKEFDVQLKQADDIEQKLSIYESLLKELIDAQQSLKEEHKEDPVSNFHAPGFHHNASCLLLFRCSKLLCEAKVLMVVVFQTLSSSTRTWPTCVKPTQSRET
jgi:hypothetical protein